MIYEKLSTKSRKKQKYATNKHISFEKFYYNLTETDMRIGVPKEIKVHEYRVGLTPASVGELIYNGHQVIIETNAGLGVNLSDESYAEAGAQIVASADDVFNMAEMIVKVKEPLAVERKKLREDQILFTYLHLAADEQQTLDLINSGATCIAYETVTSASNSLPLLTPMSEIAGRMAPQVGAAALQKSAGGRGVLLGGAVGVPGADVLVLGGGIAGYNATLIALGMGATVTVVDLSTEALSRLAAQFGPRLRTIFSTHEAIAQLSRTADLVIGAVLIPGAAAPKLIRRDMLKHMKPGAVIVDISIDQGGCFETSKPTTHADPTYVIDDIVHYCVANMPGAVAHTSTFALNNVTLPFILTLANKGYVRALTDNPHLRNGLNVHKGHIAVEAIAQAHGLEYTPADKLIGL